MAGRLRRTLLVAAGAVAMAMGVTAPVSAGATPGTVDVEVIVSGPNASAVYDGLTIEMYDGDGALVTQVTPVCADLPAGQAFPPLRHQTIPAAENLCSVTSPSTSAAYTMGIAGVPAGWAIDAYCQPIAIPGERITTGFPEVDFDTSYSWSCTINVYAAALVVDKYVVGNDAAQSSGFTLRATVDDTESPRDGSVAGSGSDPSNATCSQTLTACAVIALPQGDYRLSEVLPEYGYGDPQILCDSNVTDFGDLDFEASPPDSTNGTFRVYTGDGIGNAYCKVYNYYQTGKLTVTASVTNDNGGTATPADIQVEVYEANGGALVHGPVACAANGACLDIMLPIGDYQLGYIGPNGYTRTVTQTVIPNVTERITDDPDAAFTISTAHDVALAIAIDDPVPTTTTTTTTTTLAPTTTALGAGGILPDTGASPRETSTLVITALALVLVGASMVLVRRKA